MKKEKKFLLIEKGKANLLKESFSFICFIVALVTIILFLIHGVVESIKHNMLWYEKVEWIENTLLCALLIIIIISMKKKKHKIVESLTGELLAIYLVATTGYFITSLDLIIQGLAFTSDYILLVIEFLLMLSCIFVFFDHLLEKGKENGIRNKKIPIRILAFLDSISLIAYVIAMLSFGGITYIEVCLDEFLYAIFGTAISYAILSIEMRKTISE